MNLMLTSNCRVSSFESWLTWNKAACAEVAGCGVADLLLLPLLLLLCVQCGEMSAVNAMQLLVEQGAGDWQLCSAPPCCAIRVPQSMGWQSSVPPDIRMSGGLVYMRDVASILA